MATHRRIAAVGAALLLGLAEGGGAAPPAPPSVVPYQGVLLDGAGDPRTGLVNLTLRIWDAPTAGTLVYLQSFTSVPLVNGVYSIQLGPTGSPTGTLTTSLADALAGDLGAPGAARFLEVTVGGSGPLPRTQVLSAPYALSAANAATTQSVGGLPPDVVADMFENWNFDGGPPSTDPREGVADTDGDGMLNFADLDNDGDGISDGAEITQGSDMNLVTPSLGQLIPSSAFSFVTTTVQVTGSDFAPGLTVSFGSESPTPNDLTPTSFEVTVGPQAVGAVTVQVTLPNGEDDPTPLTFTFLPFSFSAPHGVAATSTTHLTFAARDATADTLVVGGDNQYAAAVFEEGEFDPDFDPPLALASRIHIALGFDGAGRLLGLRCLDIGNDDCTVQLFRDLDGDLVLEAGEESSIETILGANSLTGLMRFPSLATDPSGNVAAGYLKAASSGFEIRLAHDRDGNGNFTGPNEHVTLEIMALSAQNGPGEVAFDGSGRVAYLYEDGFNDLLRFGWDRSGDGDFNDSPGGTPELVTVATGGMLCRGLAFDAAGRPAAVWSTGGLTLARDTNADGDFADAGEQTTLTGVNTSGCDVLGAPVLTVADDQLGIGNGLRLRIDRNDDGSFTPEEIVTLAGSGNFPIALARTALATFVAGRTTVRGSP